MAALHERFGVSFSDGLLERQRDRRVKGWSNSEKKTEWQVRLRSCVFAGDGAGWGRPVNLTSYRDDPCRLTFWF